MSMGVNDQDLTLAARDRITHNLWTVKELLFYILMLKVKVR
jgi:hypothetical protein